MTIEQKEKSSAGNSQPIPNLDAIKVKQKATWESGDFGQVARTIENVADEFMAQVSLKPGLRVLDVACGTGNLAIIAAQHGCTVSGIDIAANLLAQARTRAAGAGLNIEFQEADAEALPFADNTFDLSDWLRGAGPTAKEYYQKFFSLFRICSSSIGFRGTTGPTCQWQQRFPLVQSKVHPYPYAPVALELALKSKPISADLARC